MGTPGSATACEHVLYKSEAALSLVSDELDLSGHQHHYVGQKMLNAFVESLLYV